MKRITLIVPAVLVALTALAVPLVTMFTTAAAYDVSLAKNSYFGDYHDEVKIFKESYKYIETAAKLSPNKDTLGKRNDLFCMHREDTNIADLEAVCPDFKQKAIEYSGEYVEYLQNNDYRIDNYMAYVAKGGDWKLQDISYAMYFHLIQVYEYGDKNEAKKLADDYVRSLPVEALGSCGYILVFAKYIQNDSPENNAWAESLYEYVLTTHNNNLDKVKSVYENNTDFSIYVRNFNCANWISVNEAGQIETDLEEEELYY